MKRIYNTETISYEGERVKLAGWAQSMRSHGRILFVDLRDASGIVQVVFGPDNKQVYKLAKEVRPEWVIEVVGTIAQRPKNMENPNLKTGKVEMAAEELVVLAEAATLPFSLSGDGYEINEEKRMRYRYIDLRRARMKKNLIMRQEIVHFMRNFLKERRFVEVETPILTKSTPEGARDFIIPSRKEPGKFYALPQSPQQYKQLLQVAGIERYFQIARCFRDEDPRGDRQAEFTQLDIEMSFVEQEDILELIETLYGDLVKKLFPEKKMTAVPFPRISYEEAMKRYKTDKPDIREDKKNSDELGFAFVVDFPMFEWKEKEKRWDAVHHPFTRPQTDDIKELKKNPKTMLAHQYDFVLNGYEIGGGSLRSYRPEMLEAVFEIMGHTKQNIREQFGHLLKAFEYGVPPHGGIAPGIDRFVAIILGEPNIREVIAFPKTGDNRDLMMGAPAAVAKEQLDELHISIKKK